MGIEIHANAILNITEQRYLKHPSYIHTVIALLISTLLLGFLLDTLSPVAGAFVMAAFVAGSFWHAYSSYHIARQLFNFSSLVISYPTIWALATLTNYLRQRARAQSTKEMFSRFVAADVVQYMLDNPELVRPGGDKVELTIFFSDVAGFTSISEALTPEELVVLLNEYLGAMTDLLFEYGGTLDKFIGDPVMAFWNFPRKQEDHAVRGCLCALAMQRKIHELQLGWAKRGLPKVSARAGLNTADVVVGYMGSQKAQMNFTCMGDGVNLASRLEGANKEYGTALMISDAVYQRAKHVVSARFLDFLAVKGKKEPVKVFELVSEKEKEPRGWLELMKLFYPPSQLLFDRHWNEAIATFEEILARWPDDGPSATYIHRCQEYKDNPPPEGWDGRYILTHK
ncbi:MAG TPA: adenylate/guanylate cyclase domain-containing protein, partial [Candidatus Rifleibacterium sp.]|nr:adenylate/guanylate cyclase domain-containing protein [Candidatus Rifleibacterium sp.]